MTRKILLILILFLTSMPVFADNMEILFKENYLYLSDCSIKNIKIFPAGIIDYEITTDIFNTRKEMVISTIKKGHTKLIVETVNGTRTYEIIVGDKENIENNHFIKIDKTTVPFELDKPVGVSE